MRILFIVTAYKRDERDIITPWMTETILNLKERGIDVEVFAPSYRGLRDQVVDGVRVTRFRYFFSRWENLTHEQATPDRLEKGAIYKFLVVFYIIGGIIGIIKLTRSEKYDILQAHWPLPNFIFAYFGKLVSGARAISSFHGVEVRWVKSRLPALKFFLRWVIKNSDAITANTPTTACEIRSIGPASVNVIPYSIGLKSERLRKEVSRDAMKTNNTILFVGRLVERKGVEYLIQAIKLVSKDHHDVQAIIVGNGPEKERLMKLATDLGVDDIVKFAGFVDEKRLIRFFQECSLFVLPAVFDKRGDTEGQGVVLVEAMSFKKPVVASSIGGIRDVVIDGETGILVQEKDIAGLSEAILTLLEDEELSGEMGLKGYELYRESYSWDSVTKKWGQLYDETVGGK